MIIDYLPDNSGTKTLVETASYRLGLREVELDDKERGTAHELHVQLAPGIRARSWAKIAVQIGQLSPTVFKKVRDFVNNI